jgi:hypothetical protein
MFRLTVQRREIRGETNHYLTLWASRDGQEVGAGIVVLRPAEWEAFLLYAGEHKIDYMIEPSPAELAAQANAARLEMRSE